MKSVHVADPRSKLERLESELACLLDDGLIVAFFTQPFYNYFTSKVGAYTREIETASKPNGPIAKCLAGPGLLAHVIVSKFDDHLPLYRQEEILKRSGIEINRSTMCGWILGCAGALEPMYKLMHKRILRSRVSNKSLAG